MSGIEVAGLVLGSLPLIISAIEHYESSLDRVTAFFRWKDELGKALRELWIQHSYFEMISRNLLKDVATIAEVEEMLSDFQSELWRSPKLAASIREKLGAAYSVYTYTILQMESHMKTLASHLNIERQRGTSNELEAIIIANQATATSAPGPLSFEFKQGIRFTMKRKVIRALLQDIKLCNERLDQFIDKAEKYEQPSMNTPGQKPSLGFPLKQIQECATRLYEVLSSESSCSCHSCQNAHLLLEHRMIPKKRRGNLREENKPISFTVSFNTSLEKKVWHIANFCVFEAAPAVKRTVRFEIADLVGDDWPNYQDSSPPEFADLEVAENLCSVFNDESKDTSCPGFVFHLQEPLNGTYTVSGPRVHNGEEQTTLDNVLHSAAKTDRGWRPLTDEERYILSITLASSLLQLHGTPWLPSLWRKPNISFPVILSGERRTVDIKHPFLTESSRQINDSPSSPASPLSDQDMGTDEESLNFLVLAQLFLEIRFSDRVDSIRLDEEPESPDGAHQTPDLHLIKQWVMRERGNLSFAFRDAISYCMRCFADPDARIRDIKFRYSLIERIVVPLLEELSYWRGDIKGI